MIETTIRYGLPAEFGLNVQVEESPGEWEADDFNPLERFDNEGFVVVRRLISPELCDRVSEAYRNEVKSFGGEMRRQTSAQMSRHIFTKCGLMANALLGVHDLRNPTFAEFQDAVISVLTGANIQEIITALLREAPTLVESMFFESTLAGVPLHADGDYMDSNITGSMVGSWFALEDILPHAGRFIVIPQSHRPESIPTNAAALLREFRHRQAETTANPKAAASANLMQRLREMQVLHRAVAKGGLQIIAPALKKGDAVFWSASLLHGSLPPEAPELSRRSLTAHYIAESHDFVLNGRPISFERETHNGMQLRRMDDTNASGKT